MNTAVLFLVFNRPETTRLVFETIRRARPPRLYVAADGPREGEPADAGRCDQVRDIATTVDWPCEVKQLFQQGNLGGRAGPLAGIDWFFEHEREGIILEDDCLPDHSFFNYCEELLHRFRDDAGVRAVSGTCYHGRAHSHAASYYFSRTPDIWGWATWRRAWLEYDRALTGWPAVRDTDWLRRVGDGHADFQQYWTQVFDEQANAARPDTWDYQWVFSCWIADGVAIRPSRNLVVNIGSGADATRMNDAGGVTSAMPLESMPFPMSHPDSTARDRVADRWEDVHVFGVRSHSSMLRLVRGFRRAASWIRRLTA